MKLDKCVAQLQDLRLDRESFLDGKYNPVLDKGRPEFADNPFVADIEAIDTALAAIDDLKEARKLLRYAVDGFHTLGSELDEHCKLENFDCALCPINNGGNCKAWRLKAAAMEIIERSYQ